MVNYNCQRCGYETNHKSVFKKHLLRKNLCKNKLQELTQYELLILNNFNKEANNFKKSAESKPKVSIKVSQKSLLFNCKYCGKTYKHKQSKWRHENKCEKNNLIKFTSKNV